MGVCLCPVHGKTGIEIVCKHVSTSLVAKTSIPVVCAAFHSVFEGQETLTMSYYYCSECAATHNFPTADSEVSEETFFAMEATRAFHPTCWKCFRETFNISN